MIRKSMHANMLQYVKDLCTNARLIDKQEYYGMGYSCFMQGVLQSIEASDECYVWVTDDDRVIAIAGIVESNTDTAVVWELGTDLMEVHKKDILRESKALIEKWLKEYGPLHNYIGANNQRSYRWLKWLGAEFFEPIKVCGNDYIPFLIAGKE